jgi:DNA-binding response OmpR family regulator
MKILIIEDEKNLNKILQDNFKTNNFIVDYTEKGETGLSLAKTNKYDLIVLDYNLPDLNGKTICQRIRKEKIHTPIIMITARSQSEDKIEMLNLGVDDYITKPFLFAELLARVKAVTRRPEKIENSIISIEDIVIDLNKFKVTKNNKKINLTPKEFLILEYLIRNRGVAVSQEDIMENVWDRNVNILSKTVKTHIMNLRKKINQDSQKDIIKTIKRKKYIIDIKQ